MQTDASFTAFVGSVPKAYDEFMVPMFMRPYAEEMGHRVANHVPKSILETAAGTGVLTEQLCLLNPGAEITASDLNEDMLDQAKASRPNLEVTWQVADATALPYPDGWFDVVVMQFGFMFLPDKLAGMNEAYRVLRPGGRYLFNTWNSVENNEVVQATRNALMDEIVPGPPTMLDIPFSCYNTAEIVGLLEAAGFETHEPEFVEKPQVAETAEKAASGIVFGSPLYGAIMEAGRNPQEIKSKLAKALGEKFGNAPMEGTMSAIFFEGRKHR